MIRQKGHTVVFETQPVIVSSAAVGGRKEANGPLAKYFDYLNPQTTFRQKSWEKAESRMQELALSIARRKAILPGDKIDALFSGDLLNQCIGSSFASRGTNLPHIGLYGACSTMAESLMLASAAVNAGYCQAAAAMTSSHFASAERQYRFPLVYGGQRTPTAQWTVTAAGCCIVSSIGIGPVVQAATVGKIVDWGIKDANNMGAAMAPAAYDTLRQHFDDLGLGPEHYDLIVTGDLGLLGKEILLDLFRQDGVSIGGVYDDCGTMIYDIQKQDVHAGGSGCGCGASVLCGYLMHRFEQKKIKRLLFCATGALLSPTSSFQGESIPAVCHAVSIEAERR